MLCEGYKDSTDAQPTCKDYSCSCESPKTSALFSCRTTRSFWTGFEAAWCFRCSCHLQKHALNAASAAALQVRWRNAQFLGFYLVNLTVLQLLTALRCPKKPSACLNLSREHRNTGLHSSSSSFHCAGWMLVMCLGEYRASSWILEAAGSLE